MKELAEWDSFYLIVGAAAAALIGLQFVAMSLIANLPRIRKPEAAAAFATPTIVHFTAALVLSAIVRAPWESVGTAAVLWGIMGLIGIIYTCLVTVKMRRQGAYDPVFEDWAFHALLPLAAYGALVVSAIFAFSNAHVALFGVGAVTLLLLLIGIHNSWDAVTWNVFAGGHEEEDGADSRECQKNSASPPDER